MAKQPDSSPVVVYMGMEPGTDEQSSVDVPTILRSFGATVLDASHLYDETTRGAVVNVNGIRQEDYELACEYAEASGVMLAIRTAMHSTGQEAKQLKRLASLGVRTVAYSNPDIARSAIALFLQAHVGYRVPPIDTIHRGTWGIDPTAS